MSYTLNTNYLYILPEISLIFISVFGIIIVGISNFSPQATLLEKKLIITPAILTITLRGLFFVSFLIFLMHFYLSQNAQLCFNAQSIIDFYSLVLKNSVVLSTAIILLCSSEYLFNHRRALMEFSILIVLATLFLFILLSAYNLFVLFMGIIGFSLNVYVLLLSDCFNKASREASIKYYYLSTLSSGLIISGILIAYLIFHSTNFLTITWLLHCWSVTNNLIEYHLILSIMLYFIIFGFLFKLSAFPCHLWSPEIYDGAPHPITAFFILPIKIATFGIFLRLLTYVFNDLHLVWNHLIWGASVMSMIWGALGGLVEVRLKRFIAYSSINQMGFLLIGLVCGTFEGIRSSLIFLFIYVISNIGFFLLFLTTRDEKTNRALTYLTDLNNFATQNRLLSITLVIILFSLAGIPPLAGFFGKFYLLLHAFESGYYVVVIVGLLTSMISTFYYLRLIKIMWFEKPQSIENLNHTKYNFINRLNNTTLTCYFFIEVLLISFVTWSQFLFKIMDLVTYSCLMPLTPIF